MQNNSTATETQNPVMENEIRIRTKSRVTNLIHYALHLLESRNKDSITIKATGKAIPKAIFVAEKVKYDYPGLHQNASIGDTAITDTSPSGEDPVESERIVSYIEITISKQAMDKTSPGYQKPSEGSSDIQSPPSETRRRNQGRRTTRTNNPQANRTSKPGNTTSRAPNTTNEQGSTSPQTRGASRRRVTNATTT